MDFPVNFIKATEERATTEKYVPAPYFRRSFELCEVPESASLLITGLGYYEVYINGENITKGYFAPYRSNIDDYIYYDKYDVSAKLKKGKNTIGIILGNGIRNPMGAFIWDFDRAPFVGVPETAFSLELDFGGDNKQLISSDENTLTAPSPIIFDDLHFGEYYDARLEIPDWNLPDFDDSSWNPALKAQAPRGEARLCEADPIKVIRTIKPVSVTELDGSYIYDFGVNTAGLCTLKIRGTAGQKVLLRYFETLKDGKPYFKNNRFNDEDRYQEDEYYLSGKGDEEYTPRFTYHGFRYVLVTGVTKEQATEDLLTYLEMSSLTEKAGEFTCSCEVINKIEEATVRSDISNFYYFPTDCPQREKNGWTADASLSAEQMLLNLRPERSYKEWMRNIYKALRDNGQLPGIIPTGGWGYHWGNGPAWDNVIINLPYYTYIYRGDKEMLEELSIPLMRYLNYLFSRLDEKGIIAIGLGDWCQAGRGDGDYETPLAVTDTILTYDIARKAAFVYDVLGKEPQKQFALALADRVKTAFRDNLLDKESGAVHGNTQTGQAMALFYGMLTEEEKPKALELLLKYIDEAGGHFNTGVLGGKVLYRVLAENGKVDLAYNMIVRPDFPSYGNWIKRGATTLWEAFRPEGGWIPSLNHHFWGDVSAWFYTYLAGIRVNPTGRDTSNLDIKPLFPEKLDSVKAYHDTPHGRIAVNWRKNGGEITLEIEAASALHGVIATPEKYKFSDGDSEKELKSGKYVIVRI